MGPSSKRGSTVGFIEPEMTFLPQAGQSNEESFQTDDTPPDDRINTSDGVEDRPSNRKMVHDGRSHSAGGRINVDNTNVKRTHRARRSSTSETTPNKATPGEASSSTAPTSSPMKGLGEMADTVLTNLADAVFDSMSCGMDSTCYGWSVDRTGCKLYSYKMGYT